MENNPTPAGLYFSFCRQWGHLIPPSGHTSLVPTSLLQLGQIFPDSFIDVLMSANGSADDPAQVYRDRVHWSRWDIS